MPNQASLDRPVPWNCSPVEFRVDHRWIDYEMLKWFSPDHYPVGSPETYRALFIDHADKPPDPTRDGRVAAVLDSLSFPGAGGQPAEDEQSILAAAIAMEKSLRRNPFIRRLLDCPKGMTKKAFLWADDATGLNLKAMPDRIIPPGSGFDPKLDPFSIVLSVKPARDPRPGSFGDEAGRLLYHLEAAMHERLAWQLFDAKCLVLWVVVGNRPPYTAWTPYPDPDFFDLGRALMRRLLRDLKLCMVRDEWSSDKIAAATGERRQPAGHWRQPQPVPLGTPWRLRQTPGCPRREFKILKEPIG